MTPVSNQPPPTPQSSEAHAIGPLERLKLSRKELITENPMFGEGIREQRKFFRGAAGMGSIAPRIILGLAGFFYLWMVVQSFQAHEDATAGLSYLELVLLTLILPASIYRAISGERERSTWEALILTRLTPAQIIAGKLLWRFRLIGYIVLLALIPIGISLLGAGRATTPWERIVVGQLLVVSWGMMVCSFGLWISSMTQRSITTLAVIAVTLLVMLLALPILYTIFMTTLHQGMFSNGGPSLSKDPLYWLMITLNPCTQLNSVLDGRGVFDGQADLGTSGWLNVCVYLTLAAIYILFTYLRLKRLEEPGRRSR